MTPTEQKAEEFTWLDYMRKFDPEISLEEADRILWNETCYPFDYETALKQLENYFKQHLINKQK